MKLLKEMKKFNQRFDKVEMDIEALVSGENKGNYNNELKLK
jgi:hypothetical protein